MTPASVVEAVDPRPKPRQSTSFILASGLSRDDLTKLTAQGFHIETQTQGRITPQVVRLRVPQGSTLTQAGRISVWSMPGPRRISITTTISMRAQARAPAPSAAQLLS